MQSRTEEETNVSTSTSKREALEKKYLALSRREIIAENILKAIRDSKKKARARLFECMDKENKQVQKAVCNIDDDLPLFMEEMNEDKEAE